MVKGKMDDIIKKQKRLNTKLAVLCKDNNITNLRLTSIGNSIASGYSWFRTTKPLLLRNKSLEKIMEAYDINLDLHQYARAQNNNDEHIFSWISSNTTESEIQRMNVNDYSGGRTSMPSNGLTEEDLKRYYPLAFKSSLENPIQDIIFESDESLANIVIYNGATGSFLDNVTRNGKIPQMLTYGIKRDIKSLEATLKFIQEQNRSKGSNTQVYLCGAPDFLGFHITEIINHKLKRIAKEYANVIYVKPVKSKFLYPSYEEEQKLSLEENQNLLKRLLMLRPDIHYDEIEYLKFNNNIIAAINDNYQVLRAMINVDRNLFSLSSKLELEEQDKIDNKEIVDDLVADIISKENARIDSKTHKDFFRERLNYYLNEREPYDFYYLGKKTIDKVTEEVRSKSK